MITFKFESHRPFGFATAHLHEKYASISWPRWGRNDAIHREPPGRK